MNLPAKWLNFATRKDFKPRSWMISRRKWLVVQQGIECWQTSNLTTDQLLSSDNPCSQCSPPPPPCLVILGRLMCQAPWRH